MELAENILAYSSACSLEEVTIVTSSAERGEKKQSLKILVHLVGGYPKCTTSIGK